MFARFDENPAMTLRVIKETKCYGRTHAQADARTDVKTVYSPPQTKFAGGIKIISRLHKQTKSKSKYTYGSAYKILVLTYHLSVNALYSTTILTTTNKVCGGYKDYQQITQANKE